MTADVDTEVPVSFSRIADSWRPSASITLDVLCGGPGREFAAVLDTRPPGLDQGDPVPPLWHWFAFPPIHAASALGEDGHPRESPLVPPLPDRRRMFGGGSLDVRLPLRVGEEVTRTAVVDDVRVRTGRSGPLLLTTIVQEFTVNGELRVVETQEIIYRRAVDVDGGPTAEMSSADPPEGTGEPWRIDLVPDPVTLFRFSALTHNAHRIHYDRPYAVGVEGHPGLLVHGPFLALLLLELPRRYDERPVDHVVWRALRPVSDGTPLAAVGRPEGHRVACALRAPGGVVAVTANVRMGVV